MDNAHVRAGMLGKSGCPETAEWSRPLYYCSLHEHDDMVYSGKVNLNFT